MYMVFLKSRPAGTKKFTSYEEARRYARSLIRRFWTIRNESNPSIGDFGYSVRRL